MPGLSEQRLRPTLTLWLALGGSLFMAGAAAYGWFYDLDAPYDLRERLSIMFVFSFFLLTSLYLIHLGFLRSIRYDREGITLHCRLSGRTRRKSWDRLVWADFDRGKSCLALWFSDGDQLCISTWLGPLDPLIDLVSAKLHLSDEQK